MPPPIAPCGSVWPLMIAPPSPNPRAIVTGPTVFQKSNRSPGPTTVPLIRSAGTQILAPKALCDQMGNQVVHVLIFFLSGAAVRASSVVNFGFTTDTAGPVSLAA